MNKLFISINIFIHLYIVVFILYFYFLLEKSMKKARKYRRLKEPNFLPEVVNPKGRGSLFRDIFVRQAYYFSLLGATDEQLSQVFCVGQSSIEEWKRTKPEFMEAIQKGKLEADGNVAASLYHAAIGYTMKEKVVLTNRVKEFVAGHVVKEYTEPLIVEVEKNFPPSVPAALRWLSIRQPGLWSEKIKVTGSITHNHKLDLTDFSVEELKVLNKLGVKGDEVEEIGYNYVEE